MSTTLTKPPAKGIDPATIVVALRTAVELYRMLCADGDDAIDPAAVPKGFDLSKITGLLDGLDLGKLERAIELLDGGLELFGQGDLIPDYAPQLTAVAAELGDEARDVTEALYGLIKQVGKSGKRLGVAAGPRGDRPGQADAAGKKLEKAQGDLAQGAAGVAGRDRPADRRAERGRGPGAGDPRRRRGRSERRRAERAVGTLT